MAKDKKINLETDDDNDEMESAHEIAFTKLPDDKDALKGNPFGLAGRDLEKLLESIKSNNYVLFYRPINKSAGDKIDLGTHEGKGMTLKENRLILAQLKEKSLWTQD